MRKLSKSTANAHKICHIRCINRAKEKGLDKMAYRYSSRQQAVLFPESLEDYVSSEDPVRAYDAILSSLKFDKLGIKLEPHKVGCPEYDPSVMLKLLVYGYSYGIRSSRKLERATHHNVSFMWITGGLKPDHKTISEFRRKNKGVLAKVLKQCARLCIDLDLIEGNTLFVDGSKIRGNASIKNTWTKEKCERCLEHIDKHIESILAECEAIDEVEGNQQSLVKMKDEIKDKEVLKTKVKGLLKELEEEEKKSINTVDADCARMNSIQGSHAGYNAQTVVDKKHGLIVSSDVVSENNDLNQFAEQINQANETLEKKCEVACADSGYANTDELEKISEQDIEVIVPSQRQASEKEPKAFDKENFRYDSERDSYICPEGHELTYRYTDRAGKQKVYRIKNSICKGCCNFGKCTSSKDGRSVRRLLKEEIREQLEAQYERPESQAVYKLRMQKVELPFGHIKRNLGVGSFLLRGRDGVKAEMSLLASCFNITRMITIIGVGGLVERLMS